MNPKLKRLVVGLIGGLAALMSALSSMEGGMTMTVNQLGLIPLFAWLGVLVAFLTGFMNGDQPVKEQLK